MLGLQLFHSSASFAGRIMFQEGGTGWQPLKRSVLRHGNGHPCEMFG